MNKLENTHTQDDEASSLKHFNDKTNNSIFSVLVQDPYEVKLNTLGISLGDLGSWDKDNFLLDKNLVFDEGDIKYLLINGRKYLIKDRNDNTEGDVFKMGNIKNGESPFFFIGNFSKIDGYGTLVKKDGHIYEGNFVISNNHRVRYNGSLRFPNGDIYEGDFIDGEPLTESTEEYSPFKKKGSYTKPNGDKTTYRYYGKNMGRPYFVSSKDNKTNENWAHYRGDVVSIMEEAQDKPIKGELSSWGKTTNYIETDSEFIFQTKNGKNLVIKKGKGDKKDREIANIINAIKFFYEKNGGKKFFTLGDDLKYRYGKLGILFSTLLSNVSEKIGTSESSEISSNQINPLKSSELKETTAKDLAKWLNSYYHSEIK